MAYIFIHISLDYTQSHNSHENMPDLHIKLSPSGCWSSLSLFKWHSITKNAIAAAFFNANIAEGGESPFIEGQTSIGDQRPGQLSTLETNCSCLRKIRNDWQLRVREVAHEVSISISSCHSISTDELGITKVSAKVVPKLLIEDQMIKKCV